jgi:hypothetical protein
MSNKILSEEQVAAVVGGAGQRVETGITMKRTDMAHLVCDNYKKRMGVMGEGGAPNSCATCSLPKPSSGQDGVVYICGNSSGQRPV